MRVQSAKTRVRDREYMELRAVWLGAWYGTVIGELPDCEAAEIFGSCSGPAIEVHHAMGRDPSRFLNVATWRALCNRHHQRVTAKPVEAKAAGLTLPRHGEIPTMKEQFGKCRSCFREIFWALTDAGKSIPLIGDQATERPAEFEDDGKAGRVQEIASETDLFGGAGPVHVRVLGAEERAAVGVPIWRSHFADCPQSREWKRG